jgi:hypothetical protein
MTKEEEQVLIRCAAECTRKLVARGVPREEAVEIASELAIRAALSKYGSGLGQVEVQPYDVWADRSKQYAAVAPIKAMREAVTPWLWVTSLIGFGMGILNSRRIAKMYSDWRRKSAGKAKR